MMVYSTSVLMKLFFSLIKRPSSFAKGPFSFAKGFSSFVKGLSSLARRCLALFGVFRLRREERWLALALLVALTALNALVIARYYNLFVPLNDNYWKLFIGHFHVSGFDPITLSVVSQWSASYAVFRHPLLAYYMYVPYLVNQGLMWLTGVNCAVFVVASIQLFCSLYSGIFIHRVFRDVLDCDRRLATLLTLFFFSFAFVLVTSVVPDHFVISMMLLLLALWVAGRRIKGHRPMGKVETVALFVLTAGTSLNNGLKIFLAALFANGRRFFRPAFLFLAVLLPAALVWETGQKTYDKLVWPAETARHKAKAQRAEAARKKAQETRMAQVKADSLLADSFLCLAAQRHIGADSAATLRAAADSVRRGLHHKAPSKPKKAPKLGVPIAKSGFMSWTDVSTSRLWTMVENLFGESVQLHHDHLLEDEFRNRPMIVHYDSPVSYVVEALVVLLFVWGVWCGRRQHFLWLCLSWFALDMGLHMGLGFGINEVYIMSGHWIFVMPIATAYALRHVPLRWRGLSMYGLGLLTLYLWVYNVSLMAIYFLQ